MEEVGIRRYIYGGMCEVDVFQSETICVRLRHAFKSGRLHTSHTWDLYGVCFDIAYAIHKVQQKVS